MLAGIALSAELSCGGSTLAQTPPEAPALGQEHTQQPVAPPCIQPAPLVSWQDYQGKFNKVVGIFGRKLERKTVHAPHYKPGVALCTLDLKDKFILFVTDTIDPVTFLGVGFDAGLDQAQNNDPRYGQGAAGYGKRFGANYAGQATTEFFKDFAFPSIFSEDPRYYRLARGSGKRRILHALGHVFVAHKEDGSYMFNFSEWLGTTSAIVVSNTFHPDYRRGFSVTAQRVGWTFASDAGFDVLREFWPEIARKLRLPFRGQNAPQKQN